jgi:hypothetical protein
MPRQDPDENLVVAFKYLALLNQTKTLQEGRAIYDDVEHCEIRVPGARDIKVFPATEVTRWTVDPETGEQTKQTYAERFSHQYRQFKAKAQQTKSGTPLAMVPFLSEGKRAELRAQNVYTVEQLASIEGAELKNLGQGGREWKNSAIAFLEEAKLGAPNLQLQAELDALKARNAILEEDLAAKKAREAQAAPSEFSNMTLDQLREYITINSGQAPLGSLNKPNLIRMAESCKPDKAA